MFNPPAAATPAACPLSPNHCTKVQWRTRDDPATFQPTCPPRAAPGTLSPPRDPNFLMKPPTPIAAGFLLALLTASGLRAQEEQASPEIAGLQQAAADVVLAYNAPDAAAIAALCT